MIEKLLQRTLSELSDGDRGQVITLEAITGALILLLMVLFALQTTVITPLSASTANQQIEEQNRVLANDVLDTAAEQNVLTPAILAWNDSQDPPGFDGTEPFGYYTQGGPPNEFGHLLNESLSDEDIGYNVYVQYQNGSTMNQSTMVNQGEPSYNAATATKTVFLHDSAVPSRIEGSENYIQDMNSDTELYNVVRVKIVVWRM